MFVVLTIAVTKTCKVMSLEESVWLYKESMFAIQRQLH